MFSQILVAVDLSPRSHDLVPYLGRLFQGLAKVPPVTLLQVADLHGDGAALDDAELGRRLAEIADNLDGMARPLKEVTRVTTQITPGTPGKVICEVAAEGYDLVVVGSRGLQDIDSLVLGSVSTYVSQHAPCPVLIVREEAAR